MDLAEVGGGARLGAKGSTTAGSSSHDHELRSRHFSTLGTVHSPPLSVP